MNDQTFEPGEPSESKTPVIVEGTVVPSDEETRKALDSLKLSRDALERINEAMSSLQLNLADAALVTGAVTQQQLDKALERIRMGVRSPRSSSIFEQVMQQQNPSASVGPRTEVVLWKGEPLQPGRQLLIAHDPGHPRSEQLRRLRQELMLRTGARRGAAFFALLSPCAREGRSQLAAELAVAFAQLGRKTLLVDADLRRPCQHEIFGASNELGLAQSLAVDASTPNLSPVQGLPKLAVLTSGGQPPNPVELLHGPRFERMISEWRRTFEYVVLDTPPTSEFSDGLTVATAAGNVLVLSRAKTTTFSALKEMRRDLEPTNSRIVGAVINSF
jgi:receptor protein-tyrosine kinase